MASRDPVFLSGLLTNGATQHIGLVLDDPQILVLDLESPDKGNGRVNLAQMQHAPGASLPLGPAVRTPSGGLHLYFRIPLPYGNRLKNWVRVVSGVDIKKSPNGFVLLPPTPNYVWVRMPQDYGFPFAPTWLLDALLAARPARAASGGTGRRMGGSVRRRVNEAACAIPPKVRYRLFRSAEFQEVWFKRRPMPVDQTNSAYEFSLAQRAVARGLSPGQVITLIFEWWARHGLSPKEERLRNDILPAAIRATEHYVTAYKREREQAKVEKAASKTRARVLQYLRQHGPSTPKQAAKALGIGASAAQMQLWRLAKLGQLEREDGAYRIDGHRRL
jgi:hypothetical protein